VSKPIKDMIISDYKARFDGATDAMLIGIRVLMGPTFGGFLILNVFWVPWAAALDALAVRIHLKQQSAASAASDISPTL